MGKADKMVERNKKVSRAKAESVCKEIERMLADKERISPHGGFYTRTRWFQSE